VILKTLPQKEDDSKRRGKFRKFLPYAFTEHGALMLASVLSSEAAVNASIFVVRAFIKLREFLEKPGAIINPATFVTRHVPYKFLRLWEQLTNPGFNPIEFERFKNMADVNRFILSPKQWITSTNAIGFIVKSGSYGGGIFAHQDLAFEFCTWLSPEFNFT